MRVRVQTYVHKGWWEKPRCLRGWQSPGGEHAAVCACWRAGKEGRRPGLPVLRAETEKPRARWQCFREEKNALSCVHVCMSR